MAGDTEMDFATELQVRTRQQHSVANAVVNVTAPIALSSRRVYRLAVKAFYHIYLAIESEMERLRRNYPKVSVVYFREVLRTKAFEEDLAFYYGPEWRSEMGPPSPATVRYVKALRDAVEENPVLIVAFCQVRFLIFQSSVTHRCHCNVLRVEDIETDWFALGETKFVFRLCTLVCSQEGRSSEVGVRLHCG
jgi:heme oxygenase